MADQRVHSRSASHLSIGEVLALLLEEFTDVTISKIRFLESQGLIDPERTPSGYRKFYDDDVELLRCILREQRENYLPLRVIKDRLDSGEIDPTNETPRPRGIKNVGDPQAAQLELGIANDRATGPTGPTGADALFARTAPPTEGQGDDVRADHDHSGEVDRPTMIPADAERASTSLLPGVLLTADELCSMAEISASDLAGLESYGIVTPATGQLYGEDALEIAAIAKRFLDAGFDARHLRGWKVAADREAGLFEQMIQPLVRQRNPHAREQARRQLSEMEVAGGLLPRCTDAVDDAPPLPGLSTIEVVVPLELVGVRVEIPANTPMMLLREQDGRHRLLPIYIGSPEASAIHYALEGVQPPRPLTHDLFLIALEELGAALSKVVVTEMRDRTFLAEVHLTTPSGDKVISSRPSDTVALAVRCSAPLFATDELMDAESQEAPAEPEDDAAEIIDEFKDFIENVSPEDFGA